MSVVKGKFDDLTAELKARPGHRRKAAAARAEMEREIEEYNLNQLRVELQITQAELARRLGISQSGVSQLLRQGSTVETIRRIVEALGGDLELTAVVDGRRYQISA